MEVRWLRVGPMVELHRRGLIRSLLPRREVERCAGRRRPGEGLAARVAARLALIGLLRRLHGAMGRAEAWDLVWRGVEIESLPTGRPVLTARAELAQWLPRLGIDALDVTLTHGRSLAGATVVAKLARNSEPQAPLPPEAQP